MSRITNYDSVASGYDVRYRNYDYAEIKSGLDTFLGTDPMAAILEVGCGTGYWLRALADRGRPVVGLDYSAGMLARARTSGAPLTRGRAEALPYRGASFDRVICINAVHHFSDRGQFFAEALRVVRPGGGLFNVGLDPHAGRDTWWVYEYFPETVTIDLERYAPVRTLRADLVGAGFDWCESYEAQTFEHAMPAASAFERGLVARSFSSQLAVLSDAEFEAGVARIREAMAAAEKDGSELMLLSELHLFATIGWRK